MLDLGRPLLAQWDIVPQVLVPDDMNIPSLPEKTAAAIRIKRYYFGNRPAAIASREELLEASNFLFSINNVFTTAIYGVLDDVRLLHSSGFTFFFYYFQYISDSQFARSIRESAALSSQYTPVYFYLFSYEGYLGASGNSLNGRTDRRTIGEFQ